MKTLIPEVIFISAFLKGLSEIENIIRQTKLIKQLKELNIKHKCCIGSYQGVEEESIMVYLDHGKGITHYILCDLAMEYDQDCILYRDNTKAGYLVGKEDGHYYENHIGLIEEITAEEATKIGDYSYFPLTQKYMGVKPCN